MTMTPAAFFPVRGLDRRDGPNSSRRHGEVKRALGYALDWAELKVL